MPPALIEHALAYLLVVFRMAGLFVLSPLLAGRMVPRQIKLLLVLAMAAAIYPGLPPSAQRLPQADLPDLIPLIVTETLIGAAMGFIASLPLVFAQMGGQLMGQQMGFGLGNVFNPTLETDSGVIDQLLFYLGISLFLSLGGLDVLFLALTLTFAHVPAAQFRPDMLPMDLLTGSLAAGFELAVRVSGPVLAVLLLEQIAAGLLMKTMPQINILSIGFAIKIILGLFIFLAAAYAIEQALAEHIDAAARHILDMARTPAPAPAPTPTPVTP